MKDTLGRFVSAHQFEICLGILAACALGVMARTKSKFAAKVATWPIVTAKVENAFIDVRSRGPNQEPETHAALAYGYSVGGSYYSGEIRLWAGEGSLESLDHEVVGQDIQVHYNPE